MQSAKGIDEIYAEVKDCDIVITNLKARWK